MLRIDISNINTSSDSVKAVLDSAMRVFFTPQSLGHLLVTTANNKLLKFDARTGRILAEVSNKLFNVQETTISLIKEVKFTILSKWC